MLESGRYIGYVLSIAGLTHARIHDTCIDYQF